MSQYGNIEYWEERYTKDPEPFEWYQRWSGVKDCLADFINNDDKILNVGCGNSRMSEDMYDAGFKHITNIDFSKVVIQAMQEKYSDKESCFKYLEMDATEMDFADGEFDTVIDKGTLDSVLCGDDSAESANKFLSEVSRVLKPDGYFIYISYGQPQFRENLLNKTEFGFEVSTQKVFKPTVSTSINIASDDRDLPNVHFVYICHKVNEN